MHRRRSARMLAAQAWGRRVKDGVRAAVARLQRPALHAAGFGFATAAAWQVHVVAGLAVLSVACFLWDALTR